MSSSCVFPVKFLRLPSNASHVRRRPIDSAANAGNLFCHGVQRSPSFRQGSNSIPQIQNCWRVCRKFRSTDGDLAKTSGHGALGERAPSVATSAQDVRCPSRAVAQKCAPPARTSPGRQPRSIDLSNKNGITPTWTIPLSSCCGGLKPDTTTIFRKKSPLARNDAVS